MNACKRTPSDIKLRVRSSERLENAVWQRIWIHDDPLASHFFNFVLSVTEIFEEVVIHAVSKAKELITDSHLRDQVELFIQQEQSHSHATGSFNAFLKQQGYTRFFVAYSPGQTRCLDLIQEDLSLEEHLRLAVLLEHLTATIGRQVLNNFTIWEGRVDICTAYFCGYHCAEELEHKGVCFDCYTELFNRHPCCTDNQRAYWLRFYRDLADDVIKALRYLNNVDHLNGSAVFFTREQINEYVLGEGAIFAPDSSLFDFLKPGFHPWDHDDRHLIARWDEYWEVQWRQEMHALV